MTEQVLAVQRMQDYIEKNKTEEISLSDLARASLFSPWYSYRLFRDCLGLTPTEYIRKYRLTQAAKLLRSADCRKTLVGASIARPCPFALQENCPRKCVAAVSWRATNGRPYIRNKAGMQFFDSLSCFAAEMLK